MRPDLTITTLTHAGYINKLEPHLQSIAKANKKSAYPVLVLGNGIQGEVKNTLTSMVKNILGESGRVIFTEKNLTLPSARNILASESNTDLVLFTDCDTIFDLNYFLKLEEYSNRPEFHSADAFAGNIGVSHTSKWGDLEAIMDTIVIFGSVEGVDESFYQTKLDLTGPFKSKAMLESLHLRSLDLQMKRIGCVQAFNMIVKKRSFENIGKFDDKFTYSEDRELSFNIRQNKMTMLFLPECIIYHDYRFSFSRLLRRKAIHGFWSQKVRDKYNFKFKKLPYYFSLLLPPKLFRGTIKGYVYYVLSTLAYESGRISALTVNFDPASWKFISWENAT